MSKLEGQRYRVTKINARPPVLEKKLLDTYFVELEKGFFFNFYSYFEFTYSCHCLVIMISLRVRSSIKFTLPFE